MTEPTIHLPLTASWADQVFPTLTSAQIGRIANHGHARSAKAGDVLLEQGDKNIPIFVVISGELETVRPFGAHETLMARVPPGRFTGEVNTLSERRAYGVFLVTNFQEHGTSELKQATAASQVPRLGFQQSS